ncbi:MAG TPA: ATPase domain-containing protein [Patescibacteria group bacterium]|nr:ATPase domain-containing protein [Patescibacteria group bacterium]
MTEQLIEKKVSTGVPGLDKLLKGGLVHGRAYLIRGGPGNGKTTLGLHFLTASPTDEKSLFITLAESEDQIRENAASLGIDLSNITILDLSPNKKFFAESQSYDIFSPAEVEREPIAQRIVEEVDAIKPHRVFIDSMTQLRYLSTDEFHFRKQVLSFLHFLSEHEITVLFTSESTEAHPDDDLQFMADGVITLNSTEYGRGISVSKFRGSNFEAGRHSLRLTNRGMEVFPHLEPGFHALWKEPEIISSGITELDELLKGGIHRGTINFFTGPSGVGKTTLGIQFMKEAANRGERSVIYTFEEQEWTLIRRCESINIPVHSMLENNLLKIVPVEPLQPSPDEFSHIVRREVEENNTKIVMIDSVAGYKMALKGRDLTGNLHALCKFLQNEGITVILVNEANDIGGEMEASKEGISYVADNVIFLRYMERHADQTVEMRKAIGVLKKRLTDFEKTLREYEITQQGVVVGEPLKGLSAIVSGTPKWIDRGNGK